MFGSQILDVLIGLILVFVLVSVICSAIREGIEAWLKTRASYLEHGIRALLNDHGGSGIARNLYKHPLIEGLFSGEYRPGSTSTWPALRGGNLPSYIPSKNFAEALMDLAARGPNTTAATTGPNSTPLSLESVRSNIENIDNPRVQRVLLTAIDNARGDWEQAKKNVEDWYNSGMDRVSGWYKRTTQWILLGIGLAVAMALNINAITIIDFLYHNDKARDIVVEEATKIAGTNPPAGYDAATAKLNALSLPIGWSAGWGAPRRVGEPGYNSLWSLVIGPILGWLFVGFAATMGAPFWFDLLNKFMVIRSTVKPHEKSLEEGSEDRQPKPAPVVNVGAGVAGAGDGAQAAGAPPPAPPPQAPPSPLPEWENFPGPADPEANLEGCGADAKDIPVTLDEELPEAEGGVA